MEMTSIVLSWFVEGLDFGARFSQQQTSLTLILASKSCVFCGLLNWRCHTYSRFLWRRKNNKNTHALK
jgi:hypothetical protein